MTEVNKCFFCEEDIEDEFVGCEKCHDEPENELQALNAELVKERDTLRSRLKDAEGLNDELVDLMERIKRKEIWGNSEYDELITKARKAQSHKREPHKEQVFNCPPIEVLNDRRRKREGDGNE